MTLCKLINSLAIGRLISNNIHETSLKKIVKPTAQGPLKSTAQGPLKASHGLSPLKKFSANVIEFYDKDDPYYEFTNFYWCLVVIDGKTWSTTEHYFQAQKFIGTPYVEHIRKLKSAREAFQFSRKPKVLRWIRPDWNEVKDDIMKLALLHKFSQHERLKMKLLGTGIKVLVEHTANDSYWGDGGDGSGRNKLGKLLMEVRDIMKSMHGPVSSQPYKKSTKRTHSVENSNLGTSPLLRSPQISQRRRNSLSSSDELFPVVYRHPQSTKGHLLGNKDIQRTNSKHSLKRTNSLSNINPRWKC